MTKNVIVLDELGNQIGLTYPKRARGLVKNGRAGYVNGCEKEIRLLCAHAPTEKTEELIMSNVINFNAEEFKFDEARLENAGSRMFITDSLGNNVEQFEIGDCGTALTQIFCEKQLEKNTDYIFRFAMTGGCNDKNDAVSQFITVARSEGNNFLSDWNRRYVYPLDRSRFKPVLSKRTENDELLRVYEVAFNSGETGLCRFVFAAQHAVSNFMPAYALEEYAGLEDLTYEQWWDERKEMIATNINKECNINLSDAEMSEKTLERILSKFSQCANINLSGAVISSGDYGIE